MQDLLPFCTTPRQKEVLEILLQYPTVAKGAVAAGITERQAFKTLKLIRQQAAIKGHSPEHHMTRPVPDGFKLRGTSTLFDGAGNPVMQWVKSQADNDRQLEMLREAAQAMAEELEPLRPIVAPRQTLQHLCNVYTLTDCHVGMLAWHKENLQGDWDLGIAEATLTGAFLRMMDSAPTAHTAVIAQLGDWMHWDGLQAVTPTSHHLLDADGRFGKLVKASIRILRRIVEAALEKHRHVILLVAEGNHDLASSVWMRNLFAALYEKNKRLQVIDSENPYYAYQHGQTMLAWHHGHLAKNDALPLLMAAQFPQVWGTTIKRYCHTGHRHHLEIKEHSGMTVVQHPTLAARDAYASRGGWLSERQARAIVYHDKHGEVGHYIVTPEMLD